MRANREYKEGFAKEVAEDIHPNHLSDNAIPYLDSICFQEFVAIGIPSFKNLQLACRIANRYQNPPRALYILDQAMKTYWEKHARGEPIGTLEILDQQEEELLKKKIEEAIERNSIRDLKLLNEGEISHIKKHERLIRETLQHRIDKFLLNNGTT